MAKHIKPAPVKDTNYTDILMEECVTVGKERMKAYDNPMKSMKICSDILKTTFNIDLTVEQIAYVLVALKASRQFKSFREDSVIDMINYMAIALDARRKGI